MSNLVKFIAGDLWVYVNFETEFGTTTSLRTKTKMPLFLLDVCSFSFTPKLSSPCLKS